MTSPVSPWTDVRGWVSKLDPGEPPPQPLPKALDPSYTITCSNRIAALNVRALRQQNWASAPYRGCITAIADAALGATLQTAGQVWGRLSKDRDLRPQGTSQQEAQEYAMYCLCFQLAWQRVATVANAR